MVLNMNYWYELILEVWNGHTLTKAEVRCGSDILLITDGYEDGEKAKIAAEFFIEGLKFARLREGHN